MFLDASMDKFIFEHINSLVHASPILDLIGVFLAKYFPYIVIVFTLVILLWPKRDRKLHLKPALIVFASAVFSRLVLTEIIRFFYHRPRPFVVIDSVKQLLLDQGEKLTSFPSGHAAFFFALAMGACFYNRKLGIFLFIFASLIGIARVFAGIHWFSDVLAGAVIGILSAWAVNAAVKSFFRQKNASVKP